MGDTSNVIGSYGGSTAPIDPVFGQRGAFPGLNADEEEDEIFYGPASDGLAYLRMVRREAHTVPKLLRAQESGSVRVQTNQRNSSGGRYEDGAFIAEDSEDSDEDMTDPDILDEDDAQDVYYHRLLQRFAHFRDLLANPPADMKSKVQQSLPKALNAQARQPQWSYDLRRTAPQTRLLFPASQEDILRGLGRIEPLLTKANLMSELERTNLGSWAWALLGRCRDVETLGSEDVGVLRSLAKAALALNTRLLRLQNDHTEQDKSAEADEGDMQAEVDAGLEEIETGATRTTSGVSEDLEAARNSLLNRLHASEADATARNGIGTVSSENDDKIKDALMVLDIIVTVVGDAFRQTDLLDMRSAWS